MRSVDDLLAEGVSGRRVLLRADLNVPFDKEKPGVISDDGRIRAVLPTIRDLVTSGAAVIVCSHLGRPKGAPDPKFSLSPVAERMAELLGLPVRMAEDTVGPSARSIVDASGAGDVVLLENLRFNPGETSKDDAERDRFAAQLAAFAQSYVDDAFGAVHRKHASVYDVAAKLPRYAGHLVLREVEVLRRLTGAPERPYVVVLGGSKVSDKLAVIEALLPTVDKLLVGGGMCFTFLKAQGHEVGKSLLETEMIDTCRDLLERGAGKIELPTDVVAADAFAADAAHATVAVDAIPADKLGLDIGPESTAAFAEALGGARTVFWNGPMGVFEDPRFEAGTRAVAHAVVDTSGFTVVGGGDSAAALAQFGLDSGVDHVSTGGGASLELLEQGDLPGLEALRGAPNAPKGD